MGDGGAAQPYRPFHVQRDMAAHHRVIALLHQKRVKNRSIVDHEIDAAKLGDGFRHRRVHRRRLADVAGDGQHGRAKLRTQRVQLGGSAGESHNPRTGIHQRLNEMSAHPLGCARDDGDFAVQYCHVQPSSQFCTACRVLFRLRRWLYKRR